MKPLTSFLVDLIGLSVFGLAAMAAILLNPQSLTFPAMAAIMAIAFGTAAFGASLVHTIFSLAGHDGPLPMVAMGVFFAASIVCGIIAVIAKVLA